MENRHLVSQFAMLLAALIWGTSFVAQTLGMKYIGPLTFVSMRYITGALSVLAVVLFVDMQRLRPEAKTSDTAALIKSEWIDSAKGGILCGILLFCGIAIQQIGLQYTQAGKAGFITAMYIILIPVFQLFIGKKSTPKTWAAVVLGLSGIYMISVKSDFTIEFGDILILASAVFWSLHILSCDHFTRGRDPLKLSSIQFIIAALLGTFSMFVFEDPAVSPIIASAPSILYAGILCTGVAYTLQMAAQKHTSPVETSFILSTECLFALLGGYLILNETMAAKELLGCFILFVAVLGAQLPDRKIAVFE